MAKVTEESRSVGFGLTCKVVAPASIAMSISDAAGCTSAEVPQQRKKSQRLAASRAAIHWACGRGSPNHTTPGRILAPQDAQSGGGSRPPVVGMSGIVSGWQWGWRHL